MDDAEDTSIDNSILNLLSKFISIQNTMNQAMVQKLQTIETLVAQSRIENLFHHEQAHHLQQTTNMISRNITYKNKPRIRCVFIVSFLQAWNTLAEVYRVMKASTDFEPIVISTARKRAKDTGVIYGEDLTHEFLQSQEIPHIRIDTGTKDHNALDILKALSPDIIFKQSPWHDLPPIFNTADINFARLCYIPYSFTAVRRVDKDEPNDIVSSKRHTDLYHHRLCWRIFCETQMHKNMYIDNSVRAGKNVVVTGYPKFDYLITAKNSPAFWPIHGEKRRFRVIWAPHHSVTKEVMGFGTFVETHQEMLQWAKDSQNEIEFVLKPHPALISEVVNALKAFSQEYMDAFFSNWNALPNTAVFEGGNYGPLFMGSDVMVTDGVGFLSEYQLFEKPLIFIDSGHHYGFNPAGEIMMESANKTKTVSEVRDLCERLKIGAVDPMHEIQKTVIQRLMPYPGQSAERIVQAIREGLIEEGMD